MLKPAMLSQPAEEAETRRIRLAPAVNEHLQLSIVVTLQAHGVLSLCVPGGELAHSPWRSCWVMRPSPVGIQTATRRSAYPSAPGRRPRGSSAAGVGS